MPRMARVVVPKVPHHITQRGNNKQVIFRNDSDYKKYMDLLTFYCEMHDLDIWAYCLMPNHIHLIAVPPAIDTLALVIKCVHMRYTQYFNDKYDQVGHLWQSRYFSSPMSESHAKTAVWYVETNPVRAEIVEKAEEYKWSSAYSRIKGYSDSIIHQSNPLVKSIKNWKQFLHKEENPEVLREVFKNTRAGLPSGDLEFILEIEQKTGKMLRRNPVGIHLSES